MNFASNFYNLKATTAPKFVTHVTQVTESQADEPIDIKFNTMVHSADDTTNSLLPREQLRLH